MSLPTYPANDLNKGALLLQQLGTFWTNVFQEANILQAHMRSNAQEQAQTALDFYEAVACLSRFTVPIFHTDNWELLTILRSEVENVASIYQPDDLVFGQQPGTRPDRPAGFVQTFGGMDIPWVVQAPMPDTLVDAPFVLQNLILYPSLVLVKGLDYEVNRERKLIRFKSDPFKNSLIAKREIFDEQGAKVDEEIGLWVYKAQYDLQYLQIQFAYALGLVLESTEGSKQLMNAFWNAHVAGGMSVSLLTLFLSALSGAPIVISPTETVEVIRTEADSKLVITDQYVYRFPLTANIIVTVGQVVHAGDRLSDAVEIVELAGNSPDYSILPALSLSPSFLSGGYMAELSVKNHRVALEYLGTDQNNKAVVRFEVSGFPGDVEEFWNAVQLRGDLAGETLANLLDTRENPVGEPLPVNLPTMINPLEFVVSNLMHNNLFVIRIRQASFMPGSPGLSFLRLLRNVIPPQTTYIIFVEMSFTDSVDLGQPGSEDEAGVSDSADAFDAKKVAAEPVYEAKSSPGGDVSTYGDKKVTARLVSLTCQEG